MNKVVLMGRLTRDPDVRYTRGERAMAVANYTLAVDRRGRKSQEGEANADFIQCTAFDKAGEFAEKYFRQGMIQTGSYTDRDGRKVYTTQVIIEEQEFADSKGAGGEKGQKPQQANVDADGFMNIPDGVEDEGLPFN